MFTLFDCLLRSPTELRRITYQHSMKKKHDTETRKPQSEIELLGYAIRDFIIPETERVVSIGKDAKCTIIITTFLTLPIAHIISQILHIPLMFLQLQPVVPIRYYPRLTLHAEEAAAATYALRCGGMSTYNTIKNLESHYHFIESGFRACLDSINNARK